MPCYRFRFTGSPPVYYFGHALPAPIVQIVLHYAYEMTIWQDMCALHDKLDDTLDFLRNFKQALKDHVEPYAILLRRDPVADSFSAQSERLCHVAIVNLVDAMNPNPKPKKRRLYRVWHAPPNAPPTIGFVLPEMSNYV